MIHYIYKIIFLRGYPTGRYYLGKRSYHGNDISKDKYTGSGKFPKTYFKMYGKREGDTYIKEIIEINPSAKINADREAIIIGDKWKTDPLCMNIIPGGGGGYENCAPKAILQYDFDGNVIGIYNSECDAADAVNATVSSSISKACINKTTIAHGYIWRFLEEPLTKKELLEINNRYVPINQYTEDGVFIRQWSSIKEAGETLGIDRTAIGMVCSGINNSRHTAGGFVWTRFNKPFINEKKVPYKGKRKIMQYDKFGNFINSYDSLAAGGRATNLNWQNIQDCCKKNSYVAGKYIWRFEGDIISKEDIIAAQNSLKEYDYFKLDKSGNIISKYNSLFEAAKENSVNYQNIQTAIKQNTKCKGYYWRKIERVTEN